MPAQPALFPGQDWNPPLAPVSGSLRLSTEINAGIVLAIVGLVFEGSSSVWRFFAVRMFMGSGLATYLQVEQALGLATGFFLELGFFLIFRGVLRLLPRIGSLSRLGPLLILIGAIVSAVGYAVLIVLVPVIYYPSYPAGILVTLEVASVVAQFAGSVTVTIGTILALVAVARGVLVGRASPPPPAGL